MLTVRRILGFLAIQIKLPIAKRRMSRKPSPPVFWRSDDGWGCAAARKHWDQNAGFLWSGI